MQFEDQSVGSQTQGVTLNYLETTGRKMLQGRFFNFIDIEGYLPVAYVYSNAEDLLKEQETQAIAARGLLIVGLVALAISGVGIANITVASVLERTKEIGIRRAIGATRLEIMAQFILEAITVSIAGGAIAVVSVHYGTQFITTTLT